MNNNDDRIIVLKNEIEEQKKKIDKSKLKFIPETNCVLDLDEKTYNLNALDYEGLSVLLVKLNMYRISQEDLGFDLNYSGYSIADWISDIKQKIEVLEIKSSIKHLDSMKANLDKLLSEDKATELKIDAIEASLKEI